MGDEPEQSARDTTAWELPDAENAPSAAEAFIVDVEGFEGPLDERHHRNTVSGWRKEGLPWEQA
jgi:hypothetical protein